MITIKFSQLVAAALMLLVGYGLYHLASKVPDWLRRRNVESLRYVGQRFLMLEPGTGRFDAIGAIKEMTTSKISYWVVTPGMNVHTPETTDREIFEGWVRDGRIIIDMSDPAHGGIHLVRDMD